MKKTEVPTDTPAEFELGDTAADIQRRSVEREQREKKEDKKKQTGQRDREEARWSEDTQQEDIAPTEETEAEKDKELTGGKMKWTKREEEMAAKQLLIPNPGIRKDIILEMNITISQKFTLALLSNINLNCGQGSNSTCF